MKNSIAICIIGADRDIINLARIARLIGDSSVKVVPLSEVKPPEFNLAELQPKLIKDVVDFSHKPKKKKNFSRTLASLNQSVDVKYRQLLRAQYKQALRVCR